MNLFESVTKLISLIPEPLGETIYMVFSSTLLSVAFGLPLGVIVSISKEGNTIAIPNDATNAARALLLLQSNGIIKLKDGVGIEATEKDIAENPKNLKIQPAEAAQLPRVLEDVDAAVINTNYALPAGLNPTRDALIIEGKDSPYANIVAVRKGDENRAEIQKLIEILNSDEVKKFLEDKYEGAIVPAF